MNNMTKNNSGKTGAALVVGGGIGGMQASLDLAAAGIKVYLIESGPCIGGVMAQLDKTFPTNDCAMCTLAPRLVEVSAHKDIELITLADVAGIKGEAGNFTATLTKKPRYVDEEKCNGCGACVLACPLGKIKPSDDPKKPRPLADEYNMGLSSRPAVYIPYPQAIPNKAVIDAANCLYFKTGKCGLCKKVCKVNAIDFEQKEKPLDIDVGAVILTPGYQLFDAKLKPEYGYGTSKDILLSLEFERILSASGPFQGKVLRPSDKTEPKRIAFIQCVGSRDCDRDYCSAVCCMYATKEALLAKEHLHELECDIYFMDLRAFSKGFEEYYLRAKKNGINYIRCRPPSVEEVKDTKKLRVKYASEDEKKAERDYDMVVLSAGLRPPKQGEDLAATFGLTLNKHGFCANPFFTPVDSPRAGVFTAGAFNEPKDIPETVIQASSAAARALELLSGTKGSLISTKTYPAETDVAGQEPRVGVFICHCGTNIAGVADVKEVVEYAKKLPNVVHADNIIYACASDTQAKIRKTITEQKLNRVIVAACTPRTHEPLFRNTLKEAGLNPYLFEMANIRDQCTWVHMHEAGQATKKAKDLVRMALAKSRLLEPLYKKEVPISKDVVVFGGGLAGMTAASSLAHQGFEVHLVETQAELGGNLLKLRYLLDQGCDPQRHLQDLIKRVSAHKKIHIHAGAKIAAIEGFTGHFTTKLAGNGKPGAEIQHGAIVVATGAVEHKPEEYLYGKNSNVLTQLELEERLASGGGSFLSAAGRPHRTVVMIQCVGSRDAVRPYCSRLCCNQAVKNALKIKELQPETNVYILYRDVRTYGFREGYYTQARQQGVVFIRYDENKKPAVAEAPGNTLSVKCYEPISQLELVMDADLVALSAAVTPPAGNKELAQLLKVPLDPNGFFLEAHMKLRPVDFATDGVFLCGTAHFPKAVDETIAQANATAARVATILSKDTMELDANISSVIDENCDGCAYCIEPCPYKALTLIEYMRGGAIKKTVETNEALCKGCGVCQATCPKKGITIRGFKLEQLSAMAEAALAPTGTPATVEAAAATETQEGQ